MNRSLESDAHAVGHHEAIDQEIRLASARRRRLGGPLRGGAMRAVFRIVVDTEIRGRFVGDIRRVGKHHDLVELQAAIQQIFYLFVIDARRVGRDARVEKFDLLAALLPRTMQHACKGILETHPDAFGKEIADQKNAARGGFQRDVSNRCVLQPETVGDQRVAQFAPDIVAVEVSGKAMVIDGVGDRAGCVWFPRPG